MWLEMYTYFHERKKLYYIKKLGNQQEGEISPKSLLKV